MNSLTKKQARVLNWIIRFIDKNRFSPTLEEINIGIGGRTYALANVHKHLCTLERKGYIRRGYNQSRSIEVICGPLTAKQNIQEQSERPTILEVIGTIGNGRLEAIERREWIFFDEKEGIGVARE